MTRTIYLLVICASLFACDTKPITSTNLPERIEQWLSFKSKAGRPHIVLVSGDEEYRSEEALPQLAKILQKHHGFNCTVLFAQDPMKPGIINANYTNNIPGLELLKSADMMIIFTRFRALPDAQMVHIDAFLKSGKPVLGIRTATHAFNFSDIDFESQYKHYGNYYDGEDAWKGGFGRLVLGEKWISHHGHHKYQSTRGVAAHGKSKEKHPILSGIADGEIWGPTDVYAVRLPLPDDAQHVLMGQVINRAGDFDENDILYGMRDTDNELARTNSASKRKYDPNKPMMPIAWTKSYQLPKGKRGKAFTTTIGSSTDMLNEGVRRMIVNAVHWCLDEPIPAKAKVDIVGEYNPTAYAFTQDGHWEKVNRSVSSLK